MNIIIPTCMLSCYSGVDENFTNSANILQLCHFSPLDWNERPWRNYFGAAAASFIGPAVAGVQCRAEQSEA